MQKASKFDLYQTVTDRILALMETHGAMWVNPFNKRAAFYNASNPTTGKAYKGINTFLLACTPFALPLFAGYGQWADKKCQVERGEKATMIVYWKILERREVVDGVDTVSKRPLLRHLSVFNIDQVEGEFADKLRAEATAPIVNCVEMVAKVDSFVAATGANISHSNEPRCYYVPMLDKIHMANRENFQATAHSTATEAYYGTLLHELTHWTGNTRRLDRKLLNRFGSEAYAFEELVAELGSAMLCAELGVSVEPRADHAKYLNNWISVLKSDNGAIIKAATLAKQAAAYVSNMQVTEEEEELAA